MSRHPWAVSPAEARDIQTRLAAQVETVDRLPPLRTVAGVDVGFEDSGRTTRAAVVVLRWSDLTPVASRVLRRPTRFPYIPGLLSFREVPALLDVLETLDSMPDLILCDGQGRAHPRRFGVACHLGVATGLATIGVAKSRLCGEHGRVPQARGCWCALEASGETIGAVLRTRKGVKPVYVSPGHRVSLVTAVRLVMACCTRYRLPETTRHAHRLASAPA